MKSYRIELGISPLSSREVEQALAAVRRAWEAPSWIKHQACCSAWLLVIRHEAPRRSGESSDWLAEKLVAAIWHAIGRYARITLNLDALQQEDSTLLVFGEQDYLRILRDFRFSHSNMRH